MPKHEKEKSMDLFAIDFLLYIKRYQKRGIACSSTTTQYIVWRYRTHNNIHNNFQSAFKN
jgi:hypothetical protein